MGISKFVKAVLVTAIIGCSLYAADAEGFRDMKWGDSPSILGKKLILQSKNVTSNVSTYSIKDDKLEISTAKLSGIDYLYFDNKFYGVNLKMKGASNFSIVKDALTSKYGTPNRPNRYMEKYWWFGGNSIVGIIYNQVGDEATAIIENIDLMNQSDAYKKNVGSQGAKDL